MAQAKLKRKKKVSTPSRGSKASLLLEEKHIGAEIVDWSGVAPEDMNREVGKCLRHYGYFYDYKTSAKWLLDWAKKNKNTELVQVLRSTPDWKISPTLGGLSKIISNGAILDEKSQAFFDRKVQELMESKVEAEPQEDEAAPVQTVSRKSPADIVKERTSDFIAQVEEYLDNLYTNEEPLNLFTTLVAQEAPAILAKRCMEYYQPILAEIAMVCNNRVKSVEAKELREGYEHLSTAKKKKLLATLEEIVTDCEKYVASKQATRKPRAKKAKTSTQQISSLKYLKSSDSLKITSVSPEKVVGAKVVLLFDTGTRNLTMLHTSSATGFEVKGTTIQNVDLEASFQKKIRKPEEALGEFLKGTKLQAGKKFEAITSKAQNANGRCNDRTIILRVFT